MTSDRQDPLGPIESGDWPERLPAHVVSPTEPRRVHGYLLLDDLGRHYDFGETVFAVLTGTIPDAPWGRAVNLAFTALMATTVADAPVHAATLSHRSTAPPRAVLAIGMLGLAEQVDALVAQPKAEGDPDADAVSLWSLLPAAVRAAIGAPPRTAESLALSVLREAGLESPLLLAAAVSMTRLPTLAAEVAAATPGDLRDYPMRLPDFRYEDGADE